MTDNLPVPTFNLAFATHFELDEAWKWRSAYERRWMHPSEMQTRHLFFTLRMIWNHSMPKEWEIGYEPRRYKFGPEYHEGYMRQAVAQIGLELTTRDDIEEDWQFELDQMARFLFQGRLAAQGYGVYNEVPAFMLEDKRD